MFYLILASYILFKFALAILPYIEDWDSDRRARREESAQMRHEQALATTLKIRAKPARKTEALDAIFLLSGESIDQVRRSRNA